MRLSADIAGDLEAAEKPCFVSGDDFSRPVTDQEYAGFYRLRKYPVLYQGTALAVPHNAANDLGFSPEVLLSRRTRSLPAGAYSAYSAFSAFFFEIPAKPIGELNNYLKILSTFMKQRT